MPNKVQPSNPYGLNARCVKILVPLLVVTAIGFASKFYSGPGAWWWNNYVAGLLYEVFWCFVGVFFFPQAKPLWIASWVFWVTCFLEFLQLWHPPVLAVIRSTFIGQALIGTTFSPWDFFYYAVGCGIGWLWLRRLKKSKIAITEG
jgi:hypothetical protein